MPRIIVTGSYGTGSSAVLDLLREYDGVKQTVASNYEHMPFLCQHGLFELEARLYHDGANYISQDRALSDFLDAMKMLSDYDYSFYGNYNKMFGRAFTDAAVRLVDAVSVPIKRSSIAHTTRTRFRLWKLCLQLGAKILLGRKIYKWGRVYVTDAHRARYVTAGRETFLARAREFVSEYFALCERDGGARDYLYDHLLLSTETAVAARYFDADTRVIVVTRDPRDVYLSSKYIWSQAKMDGQRGPMPYEIEDFCNFTRLNECKREEGLRSGSECVLCVRFEDLIYRYEETVARIEAFAQIDPARHTRKKCCFAPERSIKNTQVFLKKPEFQAEADLIARRLEAFCYDFPYRTDGGVDEIFDFDPASEE